MDRIELPPCTDSLGGSYELTFDGRILSLSTIWEKRRSREKFDVGLARWSLTDRTTLFKRRKLLCFTIDTPGVDGMQVVNAEGFDADVLREFVERVFDTPSGIAASSILGRAVVVDVRKEPAGELVDCAVTAKVRLVDGTPPYDAAFHTSVVQGRADLILAGRTILAVRAGVDDHSELTISWSESVPVVTVTDPDILEPPARALRDGKPCRIVVINHARQSLKTPAGDELYSTKVCVTTDGSELGLMLSVPDSATALLVDGKELPAKRLEYEPNVLTVDWDAAMSEAGQAAPSAP
jgi:ABC-type amino acid transport substrate-binding protein